MSSLTYPRQLDDAVTEIVVFLKALTPEAKASLGGNLLKINRFPFRVGRESRATPRTGMPNESRGQVEPFPNNDLYLNEVGPVLCVSREHFLIDRQSGTFILVDRGSHCGTLLEGELVGEKQRGGWKPLRNNDVIIVGPSESKYIFKFQIVESP